MEGWADFIQDVKQYYGVSLDSLSDHFHNEQKEYYLQTSAWTDTHPSQMLGPATCFKQYDLLTVTPEEIAAPLQVAAAAYLTSDTQPYTPGDCGCN